MNNNPDQGESTVGLNTRLEQNFISPLTAIRGALEILNDYPDLSVEERNRFVATALRECERLQGGVMELARAVYDAGKLNTEEVAAASASGEPAPGPSAPDDPYAARIANVDGNDVVEVDFSSFVFRNSKLVNAFYDALEAHIDRLGHKVYLLVNYADCSIWPEAWVAFAHRAKKINVNFVHATVRYAENDDRVGAEEDMFATRAQALAHINALRAH